MTRAARLRYSGGVFHVMARCAAGEFFIAGDGERERYLLQLGRAMEHTDAEVLAYCLMSNHVHLVIVQGEEPLERLLRPLHTGFARWLNERRRGRRKGPMGPVFAERPRMVLVDRDEYLLELVRYVHNNPVRAGVAKHAAKSTWSSHRAYVGMSPAPEWLRVGYVLEHFGARAGIAQRRFEEFVREGEDEDRRPDLAGDGHAEAVRRSRALLGEGWAVSNAIVGGDAFAARVERDVRSVHKALAGGRLRASHGPGDGARPPLREVVERVLAELGLQAPELKAQPGSRRSQLALQAIVWTWVHHLGGRQIDVIRGLRVAQYSVARWYAKAARRAEELDDTVKGVLGALARDGEMPGPAQQRTEAKPHVRYQVEVE